MIFYMSQISLKNFFGKAVSENWNDAKWKSVIWPPFWKGNFLGVFFAWKLNMVVFNVQSYSAVFITKFAGKVVFLGVPWRGPPPAPTGGKYLGHLSVKFIKLLFKGKVIFWWNGHAIMRKRNFQNLVGFNPAIYGFSVQRKTTVLTRQLMWPWEKRRPTVLNWI